MDQPVVISWNFTNWVTVSIMCLIAFMLFGAVVNGIMRVKAKKET